MFDHMAQQDVEKIINQIETLLATPVGALCNRNESSPLFFLLIRADNDEKYVKGPGET